MAAHFSIGRTLSVSLVALVGLALVAGAVHFLNHLGSEVQTVPGPVSKTDAPQGLVKLSSPPRNVELSSPPRNVELSSPPRNVAPIPTRAPRATDAG